MENETWQNIFFDECMVPWRERPGFRQFIQAGDISMEYFNVSNIDKFLKSENQKL